MNTLIAGTCRGAWLGRGVGVTMVGNRCGRRYWRWFFGDSGFLFYDWLGGLFCARRRCSVCRLTGTAVIPRSSNGCSDSSGSRCALARPCRLGMGVFCMIGRLGMSRRFAVCKCHRVGSDKQGGEQFGVMFFHKQCSFSRNCPHSGKIIRY